MPEKEEFVRSIRKTGTSMGVNIPLEVIKIMGLKEDEIVRITIQKIKGGKHKN